jgi:O-antigen/teichoic acid export membrane protein
MLAVIAVGQSLLTILLIARAYLAGGTLEAVVLAYLAGKVAWGASVSILALVEARRQWGSGWWRAPVLSLRARWRDLARFGVSTNLSGTLKLITRDSELLWLGAFSTPLQVGYYKIAKAITNFIMMPVTPLISTTYREIAREIADRQWTNVRYLLRSGTLLAAAWTLPATLVLILFGPWVIGIYGQEFLPTSYVCLLILLVGVSMVNVFYWNQLTLLPLGFPEIPTKVFFLGAVLKVTGTIILIPYLGAPGMAMLLSGFLFATTLVLVWRSVVEIKRAEISDIPILGD